MCMEGGRLPHGGDVAERLGGDGQAIADAAAVDNHVVVTARGHAP